MDAQVTIEGILERLTKALCEDDYGDPEYWDDRYENDPVEYEWFLSWQSFSYILKDVIGTISSSE